MSVDTEQIIVEFIADVENMKPGIDILVSLGKLDQSTADILRKTTSEYSARQKVLKETGESVKSFTTESSKAANGIGELSGKFNNLFNALTNGGLDEFVKGISVGLIDALKNAGVELGDLQQKLNSKTQLEIGVNISEASISELGNELDLLKEKLRDLSPATEEFANTAARFNEIKSRINELTTSLEGYNQTLEKRNEIFLDADKATASVKDIQGAIAVLQNDLASINPASDQFVSAAARLKVYEDRIQAIDEKIKALAVDSSKEKEIKIKADSATASINQINGAIAFLNTKLKDLPASSKEFIDTAAEIDVYRERLDAISDSVDNATPKQITLRTQLLQLRNEMALLESQGKENTQQFEEVAVAAAKVQDQMTKTQQRVSSLASETKSLDFMLTSVRGIAGAFATADAAVGLFGEANEDLVKSIAKTQQVMELLAGLTELERLSKEKNIVVTNIEILQRRAGALATQLQAAAESQNIIVKTAATAAQWALNAAMNANPGVLLLTTLVAIGGALVYFTKSNEDATESQGRLNAASKKQAEILNDLSKETEETTKARIKATEEELKIAESSNAPLQKKWALEKQIAADRLRAANIQKGIYADEINNIGLNTAKLEVLKREVSQLKAEEADEKVLKIKQDELDLLDKNITKAKQVRDATIEANNAKKAVDIKVDNEADVQAKKNTQDFVEAKLLLVKKGTDEELRLKLDAIEKEKIAKLAALNNDPSKSGEIAKIEAEARKKSQEENAAFILRKLNDEKAADESKLKELQRTGQDEVAQKKLILDKQRAIEITAEQNSLDSEEIKVAKLKIIEENYLTDLQKLYSDAAQKQTDAAINIQRNDAARRLALALAGSAEEMQAKKDAIANEEEAQIAALARELKLKTDADGNLTADSLQKQKEFQDAVDAIRSKSRTEQGALDKTYLKSNLEFETEITNKRIDLEIQRQKAIADDPSTSVADKKAALAQITTLETNQIKNKSKLIDVEFEKTLINEKEYQSKSLELELEKNQKEIAYKKKLAEEKKALLQQEIQFSINATQQISDFIFNRQSQDIQDGEQRALASLNKQKEAELSNKKLTADQKKRLEERFAKEEAKIKNDAAKKQREADKQQAIINGLLAVTKVATQFPPPRPEFYLGVAQVLLTTGLQVAAINSKPIPQYRYGIESLEGNGTTTSDSILARLSRKERVVPADVNMEYWPALTAIHNRKVPAAVANALFNQVHFDMPPLPNVSASVQNKIFKESIIIRNNGMYLNMDEFTKRVAEHLIKGNDQRSSNDYQASLRHKQTLVYLEKIAKNAENNNTSFDPRRQ